MQNIRGLEIKLQNTFHISDIHGSWLELQEMLKKIPDNTLIVFHGDYVDRGAFSLEVLTKVKELVENKKAVAIQGNHEQMFLMFLDNPAINGDLYFENGGRETIASLLDINPFEVNRKDVISGKYAREIIEKHTDLIDFIQELPLYISMQHYVFVHAGINPKEENFRNSTDDDLLWIREDFHFHELNNNNIVFFGHTPIPYIQGGKVNVVWHNKKKNKFGIDGGCCFGRKLIGVLLITNNANKYIPDSNGTEDILIPYSTKKEFKSHKYSVIQHSPITIP